MNEILYFLKTTFSFDNSSPLLFTQFYFWAFFAIVFAIFSTMKSKCLLRNSFLFFISLFFYYKTSGLFVLILLFATLSNFIFARLTHSAKTELRRKLYMCICVAINLLILVYYKYTYFFIDIFNSLFGSEHKVYDVIASLGNHIAEWMNHPSANEAIANSDTKAPFSIDTIVLPVGISFYTFQTISYIVDVYRKRIEPVKNILDFGFYVSFFPQLVAGPIVRANEFIAQLYKPYFLSRRQFGIAIFWIINGLAKKIILSDYLAVNFIDRIFDHPLLFTGFENLMALFLYSLQVYADFSGYTDIAIGVAMLMGFYLPLNFNSPYKATNPANFWKRWHISLSKWLQDYLYIPLGGNRNASFGTFFWIILIAAIGVILSGSWYAAAIVGGITIAIILWAMFVPKKRNSIITNLNLMVTMLLGGIWHGASWNFMIWGGLNGLAIVVYKIWRRWTPLVRFIAVTIVTSALVMACLYYPAPVWNVLCIWVGIVAIGTFIRFIYSLFCKGTSTKKAITHSGMAWGIFQTFLFMSFTRLFFRSGSNLDPAIANETAWNTAKNMMHQMGSTWDISIIPDICTEYYKVFLVFAIGMLIHWLPTNFKRRYRICFSKLPLAVMGLIVVLAVFIIYQFISAELQAFIYFQF